jgi:ribonuclease HI
MVAAAGSEQFEEVVAPEIAEALAMRRAIILAKEEGFSKVIVSSDCLLVVQRVTNGQEDRSLCGSVIHDIRKLVDSFTSCFFRHVYRSLNVAAHTLAKSSEFSVCSVWRGVIPDCIHEIICNEFLIM